VDDGFVECLLLTLAGSYGILRPSSGCNREPSFCALGFPDVNMKGSQLIVSLDYGVEHSKNIESKGLVIFSAGTDFEELF